MPTIPTARLIITPLERDHLVIVLGYQVDECVRTIHADTIACRFLQTSACSLHSEMCKRMLGILNDLTFVSDIAPPDYAGLTPGVELPSMFDQAAALQNAALSEPTDEEQSVRAIMVEHDQAGVGMFQSDDAISAAVEAAPVAKIQPDRPRTVAAPLAALPGDDLIERPGTRGSKRLR